MKLSQLRHLLTVAELGGLRRAARHLGIAQPAITHSIRALEHELGVTLFERSASGMTLTPIGEAFVRRTLAAQQELDRAQDEVRQLRGVGSGVVAIGLSTAVHISMLPRAMQPFQKRYPDVRMRIIEGLFPVIEPDIRSGLVDFYIGPLPEDQLNSDYRSEKLFDNRRIVLGRRDHPLAGARSLRDLVEARWVSTSVTVDSKAELSPVFQGLGLPAPTIAVQAQSALSMITAVASSDVLAMMPQQWLPLAQSTGLLTHIAVQEELIAPAICIVSRVRLPLTPVAEHLCDLFRRAALNREQISF